MVNVIIDTLIILLNEALKCDTLLLAVVSHPGLWFKFFGHSFGMGAKDNNWAGERLEFIFNEKLEETQLELDHHPATAYPKSESPTPTYHQEFEQDFMPFYNDVVTSSDLTKIDLYLQGINAVLSKINIPQ